jgi:hypothetical protein
MLFTIVLIRFLSEINWQNFDFEKYPLAANAAYSDVILKPGDLLFIPRWCWHLVMAVDAKTAASWMAVNSPPTRTHRTSDSSTYPGGYGGYEDYGGYGGFREYTHTMSVSFWWGPRIELELDVGVDVSSAPL